MKKAAGTRAHGSPGQRFGCVQAARLKFVPRTPIANLRRTVENDFHAGQGTRARRGIGQITAHDFNPERIKKIRPAPRANKCPDMIARGDQPFRQMAAEQTRRPGNQNAAPARRRAGRHLCWLIQSAAFPRVDRGEPVSSCEPWLRSSSLFVPPGSCSSHLLGQKARPM